MSAEPPADTARERAPRHHGLDALRAYAMFLGVVLHAAMAYIPGVPWGSHDPDAAGWVGLVLYAIHGFRMQLFFFVAGFFTWMLIQRRGSRETLRHRFHRILLPCLAGVVVVLPVQHAVEGWAIRNETSVPVKGKGNERAQAFVDALRGRQSRSAIAQLDSGLDPDSQDPAFGVTLLGWAALCDDARVAGELVRRGADVNGRDRGQSTPLNSAAFRGSVAVAKLLLESGADPTLKSQDGYTPLQSALAPPALSDGIAQALSIQLPPEPARTASRREVIRMLPGGNDILAKSGGATPETRFATGIVAWREAYGAWLANGPALGATPGAFHLWTTNLFDHLWFLWMLWWMVLLTVAATPWIARISPGAFPWLSRRDRILWLVLPTAALQVFQGLGGPVIGADTSTGLGPMPHVFAYYLLFFAAGALVQHRGFVPSTKSKEWVFELGLANLVCLPIALTFVSSQNASGLFLGGVAQGAYAWLSIFGLIGLFNRFLDRESPRVRFLADSSYFLYIFHIIPVLVLQHGLRGVSLPVAAKLVLVTAAATVGLLVIYQFGVRFTWLGTFLNGKKDRPRTA